MNEDVKNLHFSLLFRNYDLSLHRNLKLLLKIEHDCIIKQDKKGAATPPFTIHILLYRQHRHIVAVQPAILPVCHQQQP